MRRILILTVALFLALALVGELLLPTIIARGVAAGLKDMLGPGDTLNVQLKAYPALKMLTGRFDEVTVKSTNVQAAGLMIDQLTATMREVSVNLRDLLTKRQIKVNRSSNIDVTLTISEANLKQYVLDNVKGIKEPRVLVQPGKVVSGGYLTFSGKDYFVVAEGKFVVKAGDKIGLELISLKIDDQELPVGVLNKVMDMVGGADLFIDMTKFPLPLEAKEVQMNDKNLVIIARAKTR